MKLRRIMSRRRSKTSLGNWLEEESVERSTTVSQDKDYADAEEENNFTIEATTELLYEIFSRLAPPILFKFRLVSKSFCDLIRESHFAARHSRNCKAIAGNGITGFFLQGDRESWFGKRDEIAWLLIESGAGGLPDPSLQFLKQQRKYDKVEIYDSCNGLLLCMITIRAAKVKTCFICNPLTKEKLAVPHPQARVSCHRLCYALMADYSSNWGHFSYKIVCLMRPNHDDPCQSPRLAIWSSETGEWEVFDEEFPPLNNRFDMASKVFYNGSLYWDCLEGHILVCHLNIVHKQQPSFQLIEAPEAPLGRCLWKSANKLHCYCFEIEDIYPEWTLEMNDKQEFKWKLEDGEQFRALSGDVSRLLLNDSWKARTAMGAGSRLPLKVIAYAPESKIIFLFIANRIYEYQFTKRTLEILTGQQEFVVPYVHTLAPIDIGGVTDMKVQKANKMTVKEENKDSQRDNFEESAETFVNKMKTKGR